MAEGLLRHKAEELGIKNMEITSAGIATLGGDEVSPNAVKALKKYGVDISAHRSRALSKYLIDESDLVVCMTASHIKALENYVPKEKLKLLGDGISDPYGGDERVYEECAKEISFAVYKLLEEIGEIKCSQ